MKFERVDLGSDIEKVARARAMLEAKGFVLSIVGFWQLAGIIGNTYLYPEGLVLSPTIYALQALGFVILATTAFIAFTGLFTLWACYRVHWYAMRLSAILCATIFALYAGISAVFLLFSPFVATSFALALITIRIIVDLSDVRMTAVLHKDANA